MTTRGELLARLAAWERGELHEEAEADLLQQLVACGLAWSLSGQSQRLAARMCRDGLLDDADTFLAREYCEKELRP